MSLRIKRIDVNGFRQAARDFWEFAHDLEVLLVAARAADPRSFERVELTVEAWRNRDDLAVVGALADLYHWKPNQLARRALHQRAADEGCSYDDVRHRALVAGLILALGDEDQPRRRRFGQGGWLVDERGRRI